jgi:uncharacterized protein
MSLQDGSLSRRGFGAILAASGVAAAQQQPQTAAPTPNTSVQQQQQRRREPRPEVEPFTAPIEFTRHDQKSKVEPFPMVQVRVTGGLAQEAQEWNRGYMSRLAADRLLYNFRANAGLSTDNAKPLGDPSGRSWEKAADGTRGTELRGHFTGHFLSASALLYASTGDKEAKAKGDEIVDGLAKCQAKLGGGYLSAFPMELFDRLDSLSGRQRTGPPQPGEPALPWAPFYTIHKIMAGMFDMYQLTGNKQALQVLEGMAGWADQWTASKSEEHMQQILETEYGGMAETLYNLAAATNNDQWAKAGDRYTKKWFFNMMGMRRDQLHRGNHGYPMHVNTHIPQVIGAARRYEISGDMRFHDVADFFWYAVVNDRSYVTEGTSNGESWQMEPRRLAAELKETRTTSTAECCCAYNMLKLTRRLYGWTADPRYFDYYERSLFNHRIGTILPDKGYTQYYLSLVPGTYKTFGTEDNSFWCCTGTGVEEYAKINDSIYWRDGDGIYVNLFIPSELNWAEKGFKLRQETRFPEQQGTSLAVTVDRPTQMALRLRIPAWLSSGPTVKLNGRPLDATAAPGSYLTLSRTWKTGDRIEMDLPMHLSAEAMPDDPHTQAFLYGPIVLAGDLGSEGLEERMLIGPSAPRPAGSIQIPALKASGELTSWMKPADKPLSFRAAGQSLVPLNSIFGKRYVVYWQVG